MKHELLSGAMLILFASLVGCTTPPDRIVYKEYAGYNYCHMKVETRTDPANPSQREVIDFYGPCDESPSSIASRHRSSRDHTE
ncbi:MAG TPA: hypothetical protein VM260_18880 [Pirellula sp.]|nr:hypothetical protein [Pirellula sp.]